MTKIMDCTIRDGGLLNNGRFSDECILATLNAAEKSGIDYFEAGYKMPECITKSKIKLVIMVNVKDVQPVSKLADCVRVACYPEQIQSGISVVEKYKEDGFEVFLHLMTADKLGKEHYEILKDWKDKHILTSVYFADSYGAFMPSDVENIYKKLHACGFKNISFHAHNNLQLAFTNTIKAMELGAYSVDASAFGMGRGAGNLPVELLLKYLKINNAQYLDVIKKYYIDLSKKYIWGYNYETLIGGLWNIHPNSVSQAIE